MSVDKYNFDEKVKRNMDAIPEYYKSAFFILLFICLLLYAIYLILSAFTIIPESGVDMVALKDAILNN
jgi:uncharacterized membrane protein